MTCALRFSGRRRRHGCCRCRRRESRGAEWVLICGNHKGQRSMATHTDQTQVFARSKRPPVTTPVATREPSTQDVLSPNLGGHAEDRRCLPKSITYRPPLKMVQGGELTLSCRRKADILLCAHLGHSTPLDKVPKDDFYHSSSAVTLSREVANYQSSAGFYSVISSR
jgi:hypothetical protein